MRRRSRRSARAGSRCPWPSPPSPFPGDVRGRRACRGCGALLFTVSQDVQSIERDIRTVDNSVDNEKEALRVLRAEWHYLNRPDRLEKVVLEGEGSFSMTKVRRVKGSVVGKNYGDSVGTFVVPKPSSKPQYISHKKVNPTTRSEKNISLKNIKIKDGQKDFKALLNGLEAANDQ